MMRRWSLALMMATLPAVAAGQGNGAFARGDTARLHRTLDSLVNAHRGIAGYAVHNLDTGERMALRGDSTFGTASLIKVSLLVTLYDLAE
ncbi:MAG TPA: serine hydrolase, partial [Gemmatimonadaceae bacterium]|nr:serine hydrolase [Gemmatimonadaceae bacterium]